MSVVYENDRPKYVSAVVVSTQHTPDVKYKALREGVIEEIIRREIPAKWLKKDTSYLINPTGRFVIGGPQGDTGVTGRKIIVDTYGGMAGTAAARSPERTPRRSTARPRT